jgi:hypothetical protein
MMTVTLHDWLEEIGAERFWKCENLICIVVSSNVKAAMDWWL